MKILAVDDELIALELLEISLLSSGYSDLDCAQSAKDALKLIRSQSQPYDCLLFDVNMPDIDGVELCELVRQIPNYASVPIIMITAVSDQKKLEQALESGATDYVNKPFDGLELGVRLRTASMLIRAARKTNASVTDREVPTVQSDAALLRLCDAFHLDPKPNLVPQTGLWYEVMAQEQVPASAQLFAVAIIDAPAIFAAVSSDAYRGFVNQLANAISQTLHRWQPRVTYYGDGILLVAVLNAGSLSVKNIQNIFQTSIADMPFGAIEEYTKTSRLWIEHVSPLSPSERRSANALRALLQAGVDAKSRAQDYYSAENDQKLRNSFLGINRAEHVLGWQMPLRRPRHRVTPRRISPRVKQDQRPALSDPMPTVSEQHDNIFAELVKDDLQRAVHARPILRRRR